MTFERAVALTAFAVGVAVALAALVGCGEDDEPIPVACERADSLPVAAAELTTDGGAVRFVYAGAEPCMFGVDLHKGTLYVELRTETELGQIDRRPPVPAGCAIGSLRRPVAPRTPVELIGGRRNLVPEEETEELLGDDSACLEIAEGDEGFIID